MGTQKTLQFFTYPPISESFLPTTRLVTLTIGDMFFSGKEVVDYIVDYLEDIRERRVFPDKKPGFIRDQIPDSAPIEGEKWSDIFKDMESVIMPGVTHWQSPHMHAYFPALNSYPSMLGEMLTNAINCLGFTWVSTNYTLLFLSKLKKNSDTQFVCRLLVQLALN